MFQAEESVHESLEKGCFENDVFVNKCSIGGRRGGDRGR